MNLRFTLIFLLAMPLLSRGQDNSGAVFTLQDCIDYALDNAVDMKNARLDELSASAKVKETIGIGLPQVTGAVDLVHNRELQRFFTTYTSSGGFLPITAEEAADIGLEEGEVVAAQNFFQLKNSGTASLTVSQLIFNGSYIVGLQASNTFKELSVKNTKRTQEEVRANVTKAYYNYLISAERLTLFEANIARVDSLYQSTIAMNQNGFVEKIDVDRLKVNLNNLKVEFSNFQQIHKLSFRLLKFQMNYPFDQPLIVTGSIAEELFESVAPIEEGWNYTQRTDYQILLTNKRLQELNLRNKYAESLPSIAAFANLGRSTQSGSFGGLFATETNMEDVSGLGPDQWYGYSMFGLSLSWNIFSGLQRTYQVQQQKIALEKIENQFEMVEKSVDLEIDQNKMNLDNALAKLEVQKENMELASYIFKITQVKYQEGVGSNLEVVEASTALKEAQTYYYNAMYDAIIAKVDLQKSLGRLSVSE